MAATTTLAVSVEIGRLDLEALHVGQRFEQLDGAAIEAPDVERVGHQDLRGIEIEDAGAGRRAPATAPRMSAAGSD